VTDPLVTIAMSVRNGASTLDIAIRSILWQTFPDWEFIIVDDGSTDATQEILHQFCDPRIRVIREREQIGLAARLNQCVDKARGKFISRMDADDVAFPERLERQVQYLEAHPDIDLLGHGAVMFKGDGQIIGVYPTACEHDEICRRPWWGFPLAHPTWMGTRSWFSRHRYKDLLILSQDQELLLRSYRTSRFAALPDILLGYRMKGISIKKSGRGRVTYCRQLVRRAYDIPSAIMAARGILIHGIALSRDVLLDVTGGITQRSRQSFRPANDQVCAHWHSVWSHISSPEAYVEEPVNR